MKLKLIISIIALPHNAFAEIWVLGVFKYLYNFASNE
ncbi:MAG: hypothetical protein RJA07_104 [Bacteroidota bacterium]|jgi:hypothetical protein